MENKRKINGKINLKSKINAKKAYSILDFVQRWQLNVGVINISLY